MDGGEEDEETIEQFPSPPQSGLREGLGRSRDSSWVEPDEAFM